MLHGNRSEIITVYRCTESANKSVGCRKRKASQDWIQQETFEALEEGRKAKNRLLNAKSS